MTTTNTTIEKVQNYKGTNSFIIKMKDTINKYNRLTPKQEEVVLGIFQKEHNERTIQMNWPTEGESIILGRKIGQQLKETYGLEFNPTLIDISRLLAVSPKAVKFSGKMTVKRGNICMCCGRELSDEFSMLTGMGKICSKHMRVPYITDKSQADQYREDYLKRVEEIGLMEFWIPRSQIKKWEGDRSIMLEMLS